MHSRLIIVFMMTILFTACVPSEFQGTFTIEPVLSTQGLFRQSLATPSLTVSQAGIPTLEEEPPPAPDIVHFSPFDPFGMIAISGNGLELVDPTTYSRTRIFPSDEVKKYFDPFSMFPDGFSWSPDGTKLAFQYKKQDGKGYLYLADFNKGEIRPITTDFSIYSMAAWSPNSQKIAFVERGIESTGRLIVLSLENGQRLKLSEQVYWILNELPVWIDDENLAYLRIIEQPTGNVISFVRQRVDEPAPHVVLGYNKHENVQYFALSPDRASLLYVKGSGLYLDEDWVSEAGEPFFIGMSGIADGISWSPDGSLALLESGEGDKKLLFIDQETDPKIQNIEIIGIAPLQQPWSGDSQKLILLDTETRDGGLIIYYTENRWVENLPIELSYPFAAAWNQRQ